MKNYKKLLKVRSAGFTLVELLTVIAIIGILAAIVIPAVGGVQKRANLAKSQSNLKGIATAHVTYTTGGGRTQAIREGNNPEQGQANNVAQWAQVLAHRADLNDATLYYIESWEEVARVGIPPSVLSSDFDNSVISYNVARGIVRNSSTTPLIWTTGLDESALRWGANSPWGGNEGHIGFADAHVRYYRGAGSGPAVDDLLNVTTNDTATTLAQALPDSVASGGILRSDAHNTN